MSKITPRTPLGAEHPLKLAQRDDRLYIRFLPAIGPGAAAMPGNPIGLPGIP
jgi:hypothetical protein